MSSDFAKHYPAIGQIGKNTCWAACLSWWLQVEAKEFGVRKWISQQDLITRFQHLVAPDGSMPNEKMREVGENAEIRLAVDFITPDQIDDYDFDWPKLLIFNYPVVGGTHMNVAFDRDFAKDTVMCMEPFYPLPGQDGKRSGQFLTRPMGFFTDVKIGIGYRRIGRVHKN